MLGCPDHADTITESIISTFSRAVRTYSPNTTEKYDKKRSQRNHFPKHIIVHICLISKYLMKSTILRIEVSKVLRNM